MWTCVFLLSLLLMALVSSCAGFQCHACSYSANTDKNRDCIDALDTLTAPANFYTCNRTCVIQENYSLEQRKVTSYIRTCNVKVHPNICVKDAWSLVCFFSCVGNHCNNYVGELHSQLQVQDSSQPAATTNDGYHSSGSSGNSSNIAGGWHRANGGILALLLFSFVATFGFVRASCVVQN